MSALEKVITQQLRAVSVLDRDPSAEALEVWLKEFAGCDADDLDAAFDAARVRLRERRDLGQRVPGLSADDVRSCLQRQKVKDGTDKPHDSPNDCRYACHRGQVEMRGPDGYPFVTRCSCSAGNWWRQWAEWGRRPCVDELLNKPGFSLLARDVPGKETPRSEGVQGLVDRMRLSAGERA